MKKLAVISLGFCRKVFLLTAVQLRDELFAGANLVGRYVR